MTTRKVWCSGLTVAGLALVLAGCGSSDDGDGGDAGSTAAPSAAPSDAPSGASTEPAEDEPDDPLLAALESLSPDFEGATSCTAETPPEIYDVSGEGLITGAEWYGEAQPDAPGARPDTAYVADFCLPPEGDLSLRVELDLLEFADENGAAAWLDELGTATSAGQVVVRGEAPEPSPCSVDNPKVATAAQSAAGENAVDVLVTDPCSPVESFPDLDWEHPRYSFGPGGRWIVIAYAEQSGGGQTEVSDGQMTMQLTRTRVVDEESQTAVVETLTEELADA